MVKYYRQRRTLHRYIYAGLLERKSRSRVTVWVLQTKRRCVKKEHWSIRAQKGEPLQNYKERVLAVQLSQTNQVSLCCSLLFQFRFVILYFEMIQSTTFLSAFHGIELIGWFIQILEVFNLSFTTKTPFQILLYFLWWRQFNFEVKIR